MPKMDVEKADSEALRQLKSLQVGNYRKTTPWLRGTGKVIKSLEKLDQVLAKLRRQEEQSKKRQLITFQKLEKLAERAIVEKSKS